MLTLSPRCIGPRSQLLARSIVRQTTLVFLGRTTCGSGNVAAVAEMEVFQLRVLAGHFRRHGSGASCYGCELLVLVGGERALQWSS